jgi:hypothetical protein
MKLHAAEAANYSEIKGKSSLAFNPGNFPERQAKSAIFTGFFGPFVTLIVPRLGGEFQGQNDPSRHLFRYP